MSLRINDTVPDFTSDSTDGEIRFHDWIGDSYAILFSHPKDFTPVCTTEFSAVARLVDDFAQRNCKVIGVSVDKVEEHMRWKADIEKVSGKPMNFPILADDKLEIAKAYDMLPAEAYLPDGRTAEATASVRTTFIIGPDKKLRLALIYPMSVGRNFAEILRALDAIRATEGVPLATPADWQVGDDMIVGLSLTTDAARTRFGEVEVILPYLRKIKAPAA